MKNSLMKYLMKETLEDHNALEDTDFALALKNRTLKSSKIVELFACYLDIYCALEESIEDCDIDWIKKLWLSTNPRKPALIHDYAMLVEHEGKVDLPLNVLHAKKGFASEILSNTSQRPEALVGHLFVAEGSRLGATKIRMHASAITNRDPEEFHFYRPYPNPPQAWKAFYQKMEGLCPYNDREFVLQGAASHFKRFRTLFDAFSLRQVSKPSVESIDLAAPMSG